MDLSTKIDILKEFLYGNKKIYRLEPIAIKNITLSDIVITAESEKDIEIFKNPNIILKTGDYDENVNIKQRKEYIDMLVTYILFNVSAKESNNYSRYILSPLLYVNYKNKYYKAYEKFYPTYSLESKIKELTDNELKSVFFQVLYALYKILSYYNDFRHNNLGLENVLLCYDNSIKSYEYHVSDYHFSFVNPGFFIKIQGFEDASIKQHEIKSINNTKTGENPFYDFFFFTRSVKLKLAKLGMYEKSGLKNFIDKILKMRGMVTPSQIILENEIFNDLDKHKMARELTEYTHDPFAITLRRENNINSNYKMNEKDDGLYDNFGLNDDDINALQKDEENEEEERDVQANTKEKNIEEDESEEDDDDLIRGGYKYKGSRKILREINKQDESDEETPDDFDEYEIENRLKRTKKQKQRMENRPDKRDELDNYYPQPNYENGPAPEWKINDHLAQQYVQSFQQNGMNNSNNIIPPQGFNMQEANQPSEFNMQDYMPKQIIDPYNSRQFVNVPQKVGGGKGEKKKKLLSIEYNHGIHPYLNRLNLAKAINGESNFFFSKKEVIG